MKHAIIVTAYMDSKIKLEETINSEDLVISLDGGYDICLQENIKPDLLLGDFDSIKSEIPNNVAVLTFPPEKDYTDLELALKKSIEDNVTDVTIIGGIGGRLDHTVANIQLLTHYSDYFNSIILKDGRNKCFVMKSYIKKTISIPPESDSYISIFSLSDKCTGLSIKNTKYQLENHTLERTVPLGVSNEFTKKDAVISLDNGTLLIVISKK